LKQEFLSKAKENLKIAQISSEHECYNVSATRAYFSAFQAAIAALLNKGAEREKMQLLRNKADYEYRHVSRNDAREQLQRAERWSD